METAISWACVGSAMESDVYAAIVSVAADVTTLIGVIGSATDWLTERVICGHHQRMGDYDGGKQAPEVLLCRDAWNMTQATKVVRRSLGRTIRILTQKRR